MTPADRNLLLRVARALESEAKILAESHMPWSGEAVDRSAKASHDRYLRDAREVREFVKREGVDAILAGEETPVGG